MRRTAKWNRYAVAWAAAVAAFGGLVGTTGVSRANDQAATHRQTESGASARVYENKLVRLDDPAPLLADHPQFVQPIVERVRYESPRLVDEAGADLLVRAWRFSYNARGII